MRGFDVRISDVQVLAHIHCHYCNKSEIACTAEELHKRINNLGWHLCVYPNGDKYLACNKCYARLIGAVKECPLCGEEIAVTSLFCIKCLVGLRRDSVC